MSLKELVAVVAKIAGKTIQATSIDGPVGVQSRNFSNNRIYSTGWQSKFDIKAGIANTYPWIKQQIERQAGALNRIDA